MSWRPESILGYHPWWEEVRKRPSHSSKTVWKKINSWRSRSLSKADKEIMIKSVLQAIPSYAMSIYLLPESLINDIERMVNSFWWGGGTNNKGIRWLSWENWHVPKKIE
ncbi:RNA-directed DNA polymerase (Reverse transcriptase), partial [Trifolium medium]|nr:RNA-directed DNA polymerase (Reverse transcriptase) [Trifolium medium]